MGACTPGQSLAQQALPDAFVTDSVTLAAKRLDDPRPAIGLATLRVKARDIDIQGGIGRRTLTTGSDAPLAIPRVWNVEQTTQTGRWILLADWLNPGVLHRDSFAKNAAFFTISRSNLAFANSRRSRSFSASNSPAPQLGLSSGAVFHLELACATQAQPVPQTRVGDTQPFGCCVAANWLGQPDRLKPELIRILAIRDLYFVAHFFLRSSENTK
jgi:hypothetical protein